MKVWLVRIPFEGNVLTDKVSISAVHLSFNLLTLPCSQLFGDALLYIDEQSRARVRRFYHPEDRWRMFILSFSWRLLHLAFATDHGTGCLIGRILPRVLLADRGIEPDAIKISATSSGKPYIVSDQRL